jgi:hypothetical protein
MFRQSCQLIALAEFDFEGKDRKYKLVVFYVGIDGKAFLRYSGCN